MKHPKAAVPMKKTPTIPCDCCAKPQTCLLQPSPDPWFVCNSCFEAADFLANHNNRWPDARDFLAIKNRKHPKPTRTMGP